ncbi:MAG: alpha/beta hydrolase [Actinomycetota bacterium]|nr:alpha/beta hydrolase [Actinomycetota bacterium]
MPREGFVERSGVRLQYLQAGEDQGLVPLVYVPGALAGAGVFTEEMERLAPRRVVAVSLRGRGGSDAPEEGYAFEHQVSDLGAILGELDLPPFCLMGYSRGVPIALAYAAEHPDRLRGMILLDYPARYPRTTGRWVREAQEAFPDTPDHVIQRLHEESEEVLLWDRLGNIDCPTLIMYGGRLEASLLPEDAARYRQVLPQATLVEFEDSDHEVWKPDYQRFMGEIERFLEELDRPV